MSLSAVGLPEKKGSPTALSVGLFRASFHSGPADEDPSLSLMRKPLA